MKTVNKKWRNYRVIVWSLITVLLLSLIGCGMPGSERGQAGNNANGDLKIGLIVDDRGIDAPYNQDVWQGLQKVSRDFNIGCDYVQARNLKEYSSILAQLKQQNCGLILTLGSDAVPAVLEAAAQNPQIKYICLDTSLEEGTHPANVMAVTFKVEEPAFLAGYLAGKMTKTRVAGFVSGDNKDLAQKYHYAYKAGLRYARPNCQLMKGLAATYTNKNRYQAIAERMIDSRADIILQVTGKPDTGTVELLDGYQATLASITKKWDGIIYDLAEQYKENKLELKNLTLGLAENALELSSTSPDMIPEETHNSLLALQEKIIAGELAVPRNETEYLEFIDN
ncbi:MAG: BMP family ABC transporter substrate-binding protein [Peptococcaceae bacterium]|nr:BMP family ABC transporter substrate-binding protein [Peptococcaceae bacterium]